MLSWCVLRIRPASEDDVETIYAMLRASAIDQDGLEKLCVTSANLREDGFGPNPRFECLLAEVDGAVAGLALYFNTYSTWNSRAGLYLEDLYVAPEFRRNGVARVLMEELVKIAQSIGARRINWLVLRNNARAICFYASIRAESLNDEVLLMWLDPSSDGFGC
jgi:GNAT superfamily N-acetyltransferase